MIVSVCGLVLERQEGKSMAKSMAELIGLQGILTIVVSRMRSIKR